jgi:hypothetical protein
MISLATVHICTLLLHYQYITITYLRNSIDLARKQKIERLSAKHPNMSSNGDQSHGVIKTIFYSIYFKLHTTP